MFLEFFNFFEDKGQVLTMHEIAIIVNVQYTFIFVDPSTTNAFIMRCAIFEIRLRDEIMVQI